MFRAVPLHFLRAYRFSSGNFQAFRANCWGERVQAALGNPFENFPQTKSKQTKNLSKQIWKAILFVQKALLCSSLALPNAPLSPTPSSLLVFQSEGQKTTATQRKSQAF